MESLGGDQLGQLRRSNDSRKEGSGISRDIDSEDLLGNELPRIDNVAVKQWPDSQLQYGGNNSHEVALAQVENYAYEL